ncbi:MAG: D-xylose ABC transporter ATP-binding protein [Cereibacter sphaeroides]|uniref:D-xylose ABC transporter ATP-binding protein n=1 Tax=Cereibacter sphaeroides TaxID=1063 RepID=A0A2W5TKA4_CERSP|nr:MAG: D-xylose ABC transporter ATP-binding protein [Cereibacter sphaeroides]
MSEPLLAMSGIRKTFGSVKALRGVELTVWPGEIHALMGENGAGKSTLMKILAGAFPADPGGEIRFNGAPVSISGPAASRELGIAVIYQELALAPNLTVYENVALGREAKRGIFVDRGQMRRDCAAVLDRLGATFTPETKVSSLSIAERQMVEIARALSVNARVLVMDEPTTALSSRETDRLFTLIRQLRDEGMAIIYISHRMAEIYELADRCSVLRDGSYVGTLTRDALNSETLVRMMVGRELSDFYEKQHRSDGGKVVLEATGLTDGRKLHPSTLTLKSGEVTALAGLVGAGRTELARLIAGADRASAGEVRLNGKPVALRNPSSAISAGIVYLTEDRKAQGLFLDMSIEDNVNINVMAADAIAGSIRRRNRAQQRAAQAISDLSIRAPSAAASVGSLSGGNQQKVLLARLLETRPQVLILDEPTRGVDIGAKSDIYKLIDRLATDGAAVLVISSELPEVVGLADRVLVMREGEIAGELTGRDITQEAIIAIATAA